MTVLGMQPLLLLPLDRAMLERGLVDDSFDLTCVVGSTGRVVHFPSSWPGDPLARFARMLETPCECEDEVAGSATVERITSVAVGMLGTKGSLSTQGTLEFGHGFVREVRGNGFAAEAVKALPAHLLARSDVRSLRAETALSNRASEQVLEKAGFNRVRHSWDKGNG